MEPMPKKMNYPKTVPAAVEYCLKTLNVGTLKEIALLEDDADTHFGLGMWIRNNLGLWRGNRELVEAMGWCHPDDASGPIVTALIDYLRRHPDWQVRRRALRAKPTPPTKDAQ
jgi:hypothetical protein